MPRHTHWLWPHEERRISREQQQYELDVYLQKPKPWMLPGAVILPVIPMMHAKEDSHAG